MTIIRRKVARLGVQTLSYDRPSDRWFVRCVNRTYDSGEIQISRDRVEDWKRAFA